MQKADAAELESRLTANSSEHPIITDPSVRKPFVSVIVPARNEALRISDCLQSLLDQDYPADCMEIIVVDDHSSDQTAVLATAMGVRVIHLQDAAFHSPTIAYKKAALTAGISNAKGEIIMTTD
ncbi:MAG: glycosyltransferase, partial [Chitinophagaceae bacterium]